MHAEEELNRSFKRITNSLIVQKEHFRGSGIGEFDLVLNKRVNINCSRKSTHNSSLSFSKHKVHKETINTHANILQEKN